MFSYEPLSKTIKDDKYGRTFDDMCKALGVNRYLMMAKMNGSENITMEQLDAICGFFECTPNDVIKRVDSSVIVCKAKVNWDLISTRMSASGISLQDLADYCKMDYGTLYKSKRRGTRLKYWIIDSIAKKIDCDIDEIILQEDL